MAKDGPIKVLRLIARLNVGGPARHVGWLATGLDPARFQQTLVAGRVQNGEDDLGPELEKQGVTWQDLPGMGREIRPDRDLMVMAKVLGLLIKTKPHILATHASKAGFVGRSAALVYRPLAALAGWPRLRCVHTFHGHTFHSYFGPVKARIFLALERFLARYATWRIVTISPRQYAEIVEGFKVGRPGQAVVVPLGIDLDPFGNTAPGRGRFRQELGVGEDEMVVGAVGRIAPVKNYPLFLETAAALRQARPDLFERSRFVLIGGGSDQELAQLRGLARDLGLQGRALIMGNRYDRENFFPGLDAILLTSNNEGTPVAILEGGACGVPVVATAVGGVPDLLGREVDELPGNVTLRQRGLTTRPGDAQALAQGMARLLDDHGMRAGLGQALKQYVWENHAKERLVQDIGRLYEQAG